MKHNYTHLILVLDESGSMYKLQDSTIEGVNALIRQQREIPGDFTTAVYKFADHVKGLGRETFNLLDKSNYIPKGSTALHDAICTAVDTEGAYLASMDESNRPDKVVVVIVTDGEENSSRAHTLFDVKNRVLEQETKYSWQFVFLGANIDAFATGGTYGVLPSSTLQWTPTHQGTIRAYSCVSDTLSKYRSDIIGSMNVQSGSGEASTTTKA